MILLFSAVVVSFIGCKSSAGGTYILSITASAGALSQTGDDWTFDAGTIPQYTTENVTFTVKNTGSAAFTAQGTASFTSNDFATSLSGTFTVQPGASNTFVGSFTPTGSSGEETGTLTLTPTSGSPIVINLKGTPDQSFQVYLGVPDGGTLITNTASAVSISCGTGFTLNNSDTSTITLSGSSPFLTISGDASAFVSVFNAPASATISGSSSETFSLEAGGGIGHTGMVTFTGTDDATGASFTFSIPIVSAVSGGC